jgi:hypothetical protein
MTSFAQAYGYDRSVAIDKFGRCHHTFDSLAAATSSEPTCPPCYEYNMSEMALKDLPPTTGIEKLSDGKIWLHQEHPLRVTWIVAALESKGLLERCCLVQDSSSSLAGTSRGLFARRGLSPRFIWLAGYLQRYGRIPTVIVQSDVAGFCCCAKWFCWCAVANV